MSYPNQRINPRFHRFSPLTLAFGDELFFQGRAFEPSAFGCNVEISEYEFNWLMAHRSVWDAHRRISISTSLNEIPAQINDLRQDERGKYLASIKLLDGRTWYQ